MYRLIIQTAVKPYQVLLIQKDKILAHESPDFPLSKTLFDATEECLSTAQIKKSSINEVCVLTGPGSFSGIRTGIAFAKGFAIGSSISLKGFSIFDSYALKLKNQDAFVSFLRTKTDAFFTYITKGKVYFSKSPLTADNLKEKLENSENTAIYGDTWQALCEKTPIEESIQESDLVHACLNLKTKGELKPIYGDTCYAKPIHQKN